MPIVTSQRGTTGVIGRGYRTPYLYRQIITTGYIAGGYKSAVPWRNVCKLNQSTDTSSSLGDLLQTTHNYTSGAHNRDHAFMFAGGAHGGSYTYTSCFNMRTDTTLTKNTGMDLSLTGSDPGCIQEEHRRAWIAGTLASASIHRWDLVTEQASTTFASSILQNTGIGAASHYTDTKGHFWGDTPTNMKLTFATETQSSGSNAGFHSQQHGLSSKLGFAYAGNEGSYQGGFNFRKWNYTTENITTSSILKPIGNSGEENTVTGQANAWVLGLYAASAQTNQSYKMTFATDTGTVGGAGMEPSAPGIAGRSSGWGYWRD